MLENQLEYYEAPLILGENTGYFEGLSADTEYRLSIYGSKGFGQERLDTMKITTKETVGATILDVAPLPDMESSYLADIKVYDPDNIYTSIHLYYGYAFEPDAEIIYSSFAITEDRMEVTLGDIFTSDSFHVYIEGIKDGQAVLLDEVTIVPLYNFNAYVYLSSITKDSLTFSIYGDMMIENTSYQIDIYTNDILIRTETYIPPDIEDHHSEGYTIINLDNGITYKIEVTANYQDPNTLRNEQKVIYSVEVEMLNSFDINYQINQIDDVYEITINIDDPEDYFQSVYYEVYDTSGEFDSYLEGMVYPLEIFDSDKSITFSITVPSAVSYRITISIQNQDNFAITEVIDKIEVN